MIEQEEWRPVKGYEGLYAVSSLGRVRSLERGTTWHDVHVLKQWRLNGEYRQVRLCAGGKFKSYSVHRLVAQAFLPNPDNLPCVNHKDEDPSNNAACNLEWCDYKYNNNYGNAIRKRAEKCNKPVEQYTLDGRLVKRWSSLTEAGNNGYCLSKVCCCCRGVRSSHRGYIWRYA